MSYPRAQLRVLEGPAGTTGITIERESSKRGALERPTICCLVGGGRSSEAGLGERVRG